MRTQNDPPGCAEPVSAFDWTAASFASTAWQIVPNTVPRLNPTVFELSGPTEVSVAVTVPATLIEKVWVAAPFWASVPVKVSVTSVGGVGVVGGELPPGLASAARGA